ncbi:glycosyltransferase family 4 protein, partial [Methylobacterium sp. J-048]|nr:glycosyltransferase family 4 protein [Methylobacterium sp. J-048]
GRPPAAFRRGALPDILDAQCGRLARPDDSHDLSVAIREAAGLSRRACRDRAEALYDAAAMTERYLETYDAVIARCAERARPTLRVAGGRA